MTSPYFNLRNAVHYREGDPPPRVLTAARLRELVHAYRKYLEDGRKRKPLGEGQLLVIESTGKMDMMSRADYSDLVHKRKTKRKKRVDGELVTTYDSVEGRQVKHHEHADLTAVHDADLDYIDELAARHQKEIDDNAYYGDY